MTLKFKSGDIVTLWAPREDGGLDGIARFNGQKAVVLDTRIDSGMVFLGAISVHPYDFNWPIAWIRIPNGLDRVLDEI